MAARCCRSVNWPLIAMVWHGFTSSANVCVIKVKALTLAAPQCRQRHHDTPTQGSKVMVAFSFSMAFLNVWLLAGALCFGANGRSVTERAISDNDGWIVYVTGGGIMRRPITNDGTTFDENGHNDQHRHRRSNDGTMMQRAGTIIAAAACTPSRSGHRTPRRILPHCQTREARSQ